MVNVIKASDEIDWIEWVRRLIAGDTMAEAELVRRYADGVRIVINRIVHSESVTEDLVQETFRIVLKKVRGGDVREPERLSGFIMGVARISALDHARKMRRDSSQEDLSSAEQIPDSQPGPFDELVRKERAELVRRVIGELKVERDREVLFRYYIAEEDKDQICADLGLTSQQLYSVLFRALKRYKELYLKISGNAQYP